MSLSSFIKWNEIWQILNEFNKLEVAISITGLVIDFPSQEVVNENIRLLQMTRDKIREKMNYKK